MGDGDWDGTGQDGQTDIWTDRLFSENIILDKYSWSQANLDFQLLVLEETGHYLDFQFVSPVWTGGKIPLGIPTFLPMEGVHSQNQNQNVVSLAL